MTLFPPWLSAVLMIVTIILALGGLRLVRRGGPERRRGILMLVAAGVILADVLIMTMPM